MKANKLIYSTSKSRFSCFCMPVMWTHSLVSQPPPIVFNAVIQNQIIQLTFKVFPVVMEKKS